MRHWHAAEAVAAERFRVCAASLGEEYTEVDLQPALSRSAVRLLTRPDVWLFEADYESQLARAKATLFVLLFTVSFR
ncbi:MAG: hypothetical protein M3Z23_14235 [Acidobacteriota bacterium]|nr:hypothetical protein [Acidobacteriota bacterium]